MIRSNFFIEFAMVLGIVGTIGTLMVIGVEREKDKAPAEAPAPPPPPPPPAPAPLPVMQFQPLRVEYGPGRTYPISEAAIITAPDGQRFLYTRYRDAIQMSPLPTTVTKANP